MESSASKQGAENIKIFLWSFLGLLAFAVLLTLGVVLYRVYSLSAQDNFTTTIAKILHVPALKVNGVAVAYSDYLSDLKAISTLRSFAKQTNAPGADMTDEQMSDQVIFRLANNIIVGQAAARFGVSVEDKDIVELKNQVLKQFKTISDVDVELKKRYGWDLATYENKVMRPFILQNKLGEKIQTDPVAREEIRGKAQDVLNQIKGGADFAELAKKYGEDGTAAKGGDLGYFGKGEMVPQFETAAFALKKGELSTELVETPYGFHIVKVIDHKISKVKDSTGKVVEKEQVQASHILFAFPTIEKYLQNQIKSASIHLYIKVHDPFLGLK